MKTKVLVTGADQHQGLAVIRGLGRAGVPVIAASPVARAIGHASRYASETAVYTSPHTDTEQFTRDIVHIAERHQAAMILPAVESTLVALDARRETIEKSCILAAPESSTLEWAVDKLRTAQLAEEVGVPVPKTLHTDDLAEALDKASGFQFPLVLKPRGNALHASTLNRLGFKVKYARSRDELKQILLALHPGGTLPLIQEYVSGRGVNVTALFDHGEPVVMFPYDKVREVPYTGGVSVVRRTRPLDVRLADYVTRLLRARKWHGVAMVEFKYDPATDNFVLMEINGRFCASTALSIDAGLNLPYLAYCLYAGLPITRPSYKVGVSARWLQGDFRALLAHLKGTTLSEAVPEARTGLPSRTRAVRDFILDFRPGMFFDEFKWYDPMPGLMEVMGWSRRPSYYARAAFRRLSRPAPSLR